MNTRKTILSIAFFAGSFFALAQDVHFSQFNETPQLLNPGATGVYSGYVRAIVNYKNQWMAMGNAFNTVAASVDMPLFDKNEKKAHLGAGINFFSDKAGDSKFGLTQANLCVAAILPVSRESKFALGLSFGGAQRKANLEGLNWGNQYDGQGFNTAMASNETTPVSSFFYFDLGAGLYYQYSNGKTKFERNEKRRFDVGAAYFHINQPAQKFLTVTEKLYGKLVVNIAGHFDKSGTKIAFQPSAIYVMQGKATEITAGCAFRYRIKNDTKITGLMSESALAIGIHYRLGDAIIPSVAFTMGDFSFGVSYDINISSYSKVSKYNGGAEISIKYNIVKGALFKQKNMI
ncbi:MAG TPA: PorP/SprF family type IX secretion system membrane protein [Bacteroidia bacterium]|jgi:type IX secretion system PorP/SprF family membrane protein